MATKPSDKCFLCGKNLSSKTTQQKYHHIGKCGKSRGFGLSSLAKMFRVDRKLLMSPTKPAVITRDENNFVRKRRKPTPTEGRKKRKISVSHEKYCTQERDSNKIEVASCLSNKVENSDPAHSSHNDVNTSEECQQFKSVEHDVKILWGDMQARDKRKGVIQIPKTQMLLEHIDDMLCETEREIEELRLRKERLLKLRIRAGRLLLTEEVPRATQQKNKNEINPEPLYQLHCEENVASEAFFTNSFATILTTSGGS